MQFEQLQCCSRVQNSLNIPFAYGNRTGCERRNRISEYSREWKLKREMQQAHGKCYAIVVNKAMQLGSGLEVPQCNSATYSGFNALQKTLRKT